MTHEEQVVWQELSTALNLDVDRPMQEATEEEKLVAYWDKVFAQLMYAERVADTDAQHYANRV